MDKMIGTKLVVLQCPYGCCVVKTTKKVIKAREKREWKKEVSDDR